MNCVVIRLSLMDMVKRVWIQGQKKLQGQTRHRPGSKAFFHHSEVFGPEQAKHKNIGQPWVWDLMEQDR
jgi:hypothetical protein